MKIHVFPPDQLLSYSRVLFMVHPHCSIYQSSIPFYGWGIVHSCIGGHLGCFYVLVTVTKTAMNILALVFEHLFAVLGYIRRGGIARSH